ncbi:hypothetical protein AYR66_16080 [Noviherbaspirillum denitrificans]|uniref:Uncharacterized protein n=1 Tax=Noviherbaspirillum denitrificans TaxID=1968433 RepID=A0A254TE07_9BURK|nr:hypothetical protein AYR66_16080 [Noviherbaspirillum denitrificans]
MVSVAVHQLLSGAIPEWINSEKVLTLIAEAVNRLCIAGKMKSPLEIGNLIEEMNGRQLLQSYNIKTHRTTILTFAAAGKALPTNPFSNIILINSLFGSLENFVAEAQARFSQPDATTPRPSFKKAGKRPRKPDYRYAYWDRVSKQELNRERNARRAVLRELIRATPKLKRGDLRNGAGRTAYLFLLRYDEAWLDKVLPRTCRKSIINSLSPVQTKVRDESLAKHIYQRHEELLDSRFVGRISKRRLLHGSPGESNPAKLQSLPLAREALSDCVESWHEWRVRHIELLAQRTQESARESPFQANQDDIERLNAEELHNLKRRIGKWLKRHGH